MQVPWEDISTNWVEEEQQQLLQMVTELYITSRGYSAAGAFMEKYKQEKKKTVQKSQLGFKVVG